MSDFSIDNSGIVSCAVSPSLADAKDVILFIAGNGLIPSGDLKNQLILLAPQIKSAGFPAFKKFLDAVLCGNRPEHGLTLLEKIHWLQILLPEVVALHDVTQPPEYHPEGDVWTHTMLMLHHSCQPSSTAAWAVLLHDVGKPLTRSVEPSGRIRFFGHECLGAELSEKILQRFDFSENDIQKIIHAIRNHMRFGNITKMKKNKVINLVHDDNFPLELELHRLDCCSSHCRFECYLRALQVWQEEQTSQAADKTGHEKIISGHDLIQLGFMEGEKLGKILNEINALFAAGEITSRAQALSYAKNPLKP